MYRCMLTGLQLYLFSQGIQGASKAPWRGVGCPRHLHSLAALGGKREKGSEELPPIYGDMLKYSDTERYESDSERYIGD
jgi:hypothetical protein